MFHEKNDKPIICFPPLISRNLRCCSLLLYNNSTDTNFEPNYPPFKKQGKVHFHVLTYRQLAGYTQCYYYTTCLHARKPSGINQIV